MKSVTIIVPTLNSEEFLADQLKAIYSQKTARDYDVLMIDSGSTDKTLEIIKDHPKVQLHQIPNSKLGHGRTRNLGANLAKGDYLIYITQDAFPAHERWLEAMIEPFEFSEQVVCVVGKQVPRPDCPVTIPREVYSVFRGLGFDDAVCFHRKNKLFEANNMVNTFMSNTNSAVRRELLLKIPFRDVNYAEDQALGIDMLNAGYLKAYAPLGSVNHSHDYGIREYFKRKFDEYVGLRQTTGYVARAGRKELFWGSTKATLAVWLFLLRDRQYSLLQKANNFWKAPFYNFGLRLAIRAASHQRISSQMHDKLSLEVKTREKS